MAVLFGTAGNPDIFLETVSKASVDMPRWLSEIGLDAYEYQCGNGVRIGEVTAKKIGDEAARHKITMSVHAPYYISLSNPLYLEKNIKYVLDCCRVIRYMGGKRIILHSGSVGKVSREEAMNEARKTLKAILSEMDNAGYGDLVLCPETMGKINQLGTLEEVLSLCSIDERLIPCIDFGHLYARSIGEMDGYKMFAGLFDRMETVLGYERASTFHSHFSKIEYSKGGERRHLTFDQSEFGPDFEPIAWLVCERNYTPVFICESAGTQSIDALEMKRLYLNRCIKIQ